MIPRAAGKRKKTKMVFILGAVNEKLGLVKAPEQIIRELAGWLSHEEAQELREAVRAFDKVNECEEGLLNC